MAVRKVQWPRDTAAVARSLSAVTKASGGWFWLDGEAAEPGGKQGRSYLGAADTVLRAERGSEREFLRLLASAASGQGWVTALSYELGVALLGEHPAPDDAAPAFALRADTVMVLDHQTESAELRGTSEAALDEWLARHGAAFDQPICTQQPGSGQNEVVERRSVGRAQTGLAGVTGLAGAAEGEPEPPEPSWRQEEDEYLQAINKCKAAIRDGEAYVICLTDTAEVTGSGAEVLNMYLRLRGAGAATRGAVITAGDRALVSVSPERFLSKQGEIVATHPIKGTRPRGKTAEHDRALAADLAQDPKERAENLMIVDLMRNDLSRVCVPGTVRTVNFLRVETHPRVHQLVSTVAGTLQTGATIFDVIEACFPGGSMTGAPKLRAVQLLARLEAGPRGLYSGCFGWIGADGDAELAMTIRSIEIRGRGSRAQRALVGAGGGITADSDDAAELAEKNLKAAPLIAALQA